MLGSLISLNNFYFKMQALDEKGRARRGGRILIITSQRVVGPLSGRREPAGACRRHQDQSISNEGMIILIA